MLWVGGVETCEDKVGTQGMDLKNASGGYS